MDTTVKKVLASEKITETNNLHKSVEYMQYLQKLKLGIIAFYQIPNEIKDKYFCMEAVKFRAILLIQVPSPIIDIDICRIAIEKFPEVISKIPYENNLDQNQMGLFKELIDIISIHGDKYKFDVESQKLIKVDEADYQIMLNDFRLRKKNDDKRNEIIRNATLKKLQIMIKDSSDDSEIMCDKNIEDENVDWEEMMGANEDGLYEGDSDYADLRDILENIADTFDQ